MTLQISARQLSFGMQGYDVARVHRAMQTLGRSVPVAERASRVLDAGTVAVLKALQTDLGVPATGIVDAATVRVINARLSELDTDPRVVRGSVRDANGNPFTGGFVQIFSQELSNEQAIGRSSLEAPDGTYAVSYQPPPNSDGRVDLRVAVLNSRGGLLETTPSGASILTNAGPLEVVDFVLSGEAHPPLSEFEVLLEDLKPLLGDRDLGDLTEDEGRHEVSLLAIRSGYLPEQVAALAIAHKLEEGSTLAAMLYGLLRQGLPSDLRALHGTDPNVRLRALQASIEQGIVPKEVEGKKLEDVLRDFTPAAPDELRPLLGRLLNADEQNAFVGQFLENSQDPEAFWEKIAADSALAARAEELKLTVQVGNLLNNHAPLVAGVLEMSNIKQATDLARFNKEDWKTLIQSQGVGVPGETPGADAAEKVENYAHQIVQQVEAAVPTPFFAARLSEATAGASPVATFLQDQPSYDLKTTYPEQFFKANPAAAQALTQGDLDHLADLQRVHRVISSATASGVKTSVAEETIALTNKGVRSASQIGRASKEIFAQQNQEIFSEERAHEVHEQARRTSAIALTLLGENAASLNRTGLHAIPKLDIHKQAKAAQHEDSEDAGIPDWETLFGGFDFCACQECSSAHGPAAYFVDMLRFLSNRSVKDALFDRRPDLGDIELSCENTNTVLPYIDLVNEILENAVAPPSPFVPFTLASSLEGDLGKAIATPELAAAFNPPLQPGARVDILEDGKRWRVWDEPFAYSIVKENNTLNVVARSLQTTGSAEERRAMPQYRNGAAYVELSEAVYPFDLPFDLPTEEATGFLTHLGVSRHDLIETLRLGPNAFDSDSPVTRRLAAERLGLTDTERKIIVGEQLSPPRQPEDFWGSAPVEALGTVQELLDRSGLRYAELEALLATWFINSAKTLTISAKPNEPVATCDTAKLHINDLTADVLSRMHRFVRLWRKLGWTLPEVDKAVRAFAPNSDTPSLTNEVLVRLAHLVAIHTELGIPVAQALVLWRPIDTEQPASLYQSLFYNPSVFKPQDKDFRLEPDGEELVHSDKLLMEHAATLQAIFRLSPEGLALLVAKTNGRLTLANLSLLYRHATLARQLKLSVQDLLTAIDLTGIDPFRGDRSQDTLRLVEVVRAIRSSGFGLAELDYLIRNRVNPVAPFVPTESSLAGTLMEVRESLLQVDAESDVEKKKLQESAVIDRVAAALSLPADVTSVLLTKVSHGGETALQRFLELSTMDEEEQPFSRTNAALQPQFETLEKLLKIAAILQTLRLPAGLLEWLFRENQWLATAHDQGAASVDFADWFSLTQLQQLRRDLSLEDGALEAVLNATDAVVAADQSSQLAVKKLFIDALVQWLDWVREDVETLVGKADDLADLGLFSAHLPDAYRGLDLILRLQRAMGLLKRLGVTAAQASGWCEATVDETDAKAIRRAAKAKHDDDAWLKVALPLQDSLRDKQREALVSYLVARPATWTTNGEETEEPAIEQADANDLYAHFLIDVEMSSCQLTSRLKQAIGSVQLFAQRCLMGPEDDVRTNESKWLQWEWMKNYRVWEANQKIWLYPENWIEPELRDDKTPFFKDLENELLQTDLDDAAAEQALLRYLAKVDEVAGLEIVGVYEDDEDKTLYVFGRTQHAPHIHYFRRREGETRAWTPWEKIELDIEGDHLIPVAWNRRLMLIWPVFTEKAVEKEVEMPAPGNKLKSADRYWEIQLAWSEYQYGRWSGKNLSEAVTFAAYKGENDILFGPFVPSPVVTQAFAARIGLDDETGSGTDSGGGGNGGGSGGATAAPPRNDTSTAPRQLVAKELFSFKAFAFDETLTVRGYLRRDYRATPMIGDSQIACVFGEFRFFGCRKIITTAHRKQITRQNFALAPKNTKFDRMWFTSTASGLSLFDGQFPVYPKFILPGTIFDTINEPASIAGDPVETLDNKQDIGVLDRTPPAFRLLAPHQDLQFVGDRPSFFMDSKRTFMITSTGTSGKNSGLTGWMDGNLATAWRADFFPPQARPTLPDGNGGVAAVERVAAPLTVLAPGPDGRRVMREMIPVNTRPEFSPRILVPTFWTTREYRFVNFHHPYLCEFEKKLNRLGIAALLSLETQSARDTQSFDVYAPEARVLKEYPVDEVEFQTAGAYEIYNWELFFHIPLLIATRLKANQRFKEAQRWFHFIFDPTGASGGAVPQRYWRTKPFHDRLKEGYEAESVKAIEEMISGGISEDLKVAVEVWRTNPFSPHAVARLRTTAYQKTVAMKYIDNLIAWGDQLFRRETLESLNEATQLYVLAAELLGRRPEVIERDLKAAVQTFNTLDLRPGGRGNVLEQIELLVPDTGGTGAIGDASETPDPPSDTVLYFCIPENDQLLGYWDTVADRLFKIRHCMNIEGQVRQLPLFEPPIDPALLVRAQAAGLSIADVLSDVSAPLPNYRFSVMVQTANELAAEVRSLGASLLSALEKQDAEALSLLRSGQEVRLSEAVREVRVRQVIEAETNIAALEKSQQLAQARQDYYESRDSISVLETTAMALSAASLSPLAVKITSELVAAVSHLLPTFKIGSPTTAGTEGGPPNKGKSSEAVGRQQETAATILNISSMLASRMAEYGRRKDEWDHQANLATIELKQIDQQLIAAEIRLAVAEQELRNHDRQIENARDVDRHLHDKFTNQDLYQWMISQVSGLYFQTYQLAYELAKRAERCFRFELGVQDSSYINFGYWDSLKKGLLSGEKLQYDLRRLESSYLEQNSREFELTKHISLAQLDPMSLLQFKENGKCEFAVPEVIFDLDHPGHYMRRIKTVSLSIPCVAGPYTNVSAKLTMLDNRVRISTDPTSSSTGDYAYEGLGDTRFAHDLVGNQAIATSSGQQDAGLFELSFGDGRYFPFEGGGVVGRWQLELPEEFRQFDYDTISDAVIHVRYTARDGGDPLKTAVQDDLRQSLNKIADILAVSDTGLTRIISARHEFGTEWHNFMHPPADATSQELALKLDKRLFPFMFEERDLAVGEIKVIFILDDAALYSSGGKLAVTFEQPDGSQTIDELDPLAAVEDQPALSISTSFTLEQESEEVTVTIEEANLSSIAPALVEVRDGKRRLNLARIEEVLLVVNYTVMG